VNTATSVLCEGKQGKTFKNAEINVTDIFVRSQVLIVQRRLPPAYLPSALTFFHLKLFQSNQQRSFQASAKITLDTLCAIRDYQYWFAICDFSAWQPSSCTNRRVSDARLLGSSIPTTALRLPYRIGVGGGPKPRPA
jgi:hypothetical protein